MLSEKTLVWPVIGFVTRKLCASQAISANRAFLSEPGGPCALATGGRRIELRAAALAATGTATPTARDNPTRRIPRPSPRWCRAPSRRVRRPCTPCRDLLRSGFDRVPHLHGARTVTRTVKGKPLIKHLPCLVLRLLMLSVLPALAVVPCHAVRQRIAESRLHSWLDLRAVGVVRSDRALRAFVDDLGAHAAGLRRPLVVGPPGRWVRPL